LAVQLFLGFPVRLAHSQCDLPNRFRPHLLSADVSVFSFPAELYL
jgi:hypothetical protein